MTQPQSYQPVTFHHPRQSGGVVEPSVYFTIRHGRDFYPSPGLVDALDLRGGERYGAAVNAPCRRLRLVQVLESAENYLTFRRAGGQLTTGRRHRVYTRSRELCAQLEIPGYMTHVCRARGWIENGIKMMELEYPAKENEL